MLKATRRMLDYFDQKGMRYHAEIDRTKSGKDIVSVTYTAHNLPQIRFRVIVDIDGRDVGIRVWSLCRAETRAQAVALIATLNELNNTYRWYRFYLDDDREAAADLDALVTSETIGPVVYELILRGVSIIDEAYPKMRRALRDD